MTTASSLRNHPCTTRCMPGAKPRPPADCSDQRETSRASSRLRAGLPAGRRWPMERSEGAPRVRIRDLVRYYLYLGALGFGGPVALCGQMEKELVEGRKWLSKDEMREGIAVCQSLPGPLAIQVGIFISYLRGGFWGAWAGGWAFILPNFVIVAALGALHVHFGGLSPVTAIFYGVSRAVIALILHSCYGLAKLGMDDWLQWGIAAACLAITVAVRAEVALLFVA